MSNQINIDHLKAKIFHELKKVRLVEPHEIYDNAFAQINLMNQIIITRANKSWTLFFVRIKMLISVYYYLN